MLNKKIIALVATLSLAACTTENGDHVGAPSPGMVASESTNKVAAIAASTETTMILPTYKPTTDSQGNMISATARLSGILGQVDRCLTINEDGQEYVLVFPENSAVWSSNDKSLTYKERSYRIGSAIDIAGGFIGEAEKSNVANLPNSCMNSSIWKVG